MRLLVTSEDTGFIGKQTVAYVSEKLKHSKRESKSKGLHTLAMMAYYKIPEENIIFHCGLHPYAIK